jgi:hypothetical protein
MALETQTDTRKEDGLITIQCWAHNDQQPGILSVNVFYPSLWGSGSANDWPVTLKVPISNYYNSVPVVSVAGGPAFCPSMTFIIFCRETGLPMIGRLL